MCTNGLHPVLVTVADKFHGQIPTIRLDGRGDHRHSASAQLQKAHQDATAEAAKQAMRGARARATTRRGHLEQRVEEVRRPLSLSFSTIFEHLELVIHDVAMHEFLIDQARVLNDKRMQDAIVRHYGAEIHRQLTNAMTAVAAGDVPATMAHERVANWLRTGASIAAMGWKLTTAMVQPLGLTQSMQRIGPRWGSPRT